MSFTAESVTAEANAQNRFVQNQPAQNRQSKDPSRVAIIVLGAGSGTRLGEPIPKAAVRVQGRTLLDHALQGARESRIAEHVVVTVPAGCESLCPELLEDAHRAEALVTVGGDTRTASVVGVDGGGGGIVMAARHRSLPAIGLQFHPESILTPQGPALLRAITASLARTP